MALAENSRPMAGKATPTADIMKGMRKWAVQTTINVAERETCPVI
jgi:hypothetical protein